MLEAKGIVYKWIHFGRKGTADKGNSLLTQFNRYRHCLFLRLNGVLRIKETVSTLKELTVLESRYLLLAIYCCLLPTYVMITPKDSV